MPKGKLINFLKDLRKNEIFLTKIYCNQVMYLNKCKKKKNEKKTYKEKNGHLSKKDFLAKYFMVKIMRGC